MAKGYDATEVATGTADAQAKAASSRLLLVGYSARESAGAAAAAAFNLRNGTTDTDPVIAVCELAANSEKTVMFGDGIECPAGVFVERTAGETHLVVYTRVG